MGLKKKVRILCRQNNNNFNNNNNDHNSKTIQFEYNNKPRVEEYGCNTLNLVVELREECEPNFFNRIVHEVVVDSSLEVFQNG